MSLFFMLSALQEDIDNYDAMHLVSIAIYFIRVSVRIIRPGHCCVSYAIMTVRQNYHSVEDYTMPYAIDLFCGAGGCSEGLIQAGFHILFSSDISDMVEKTYRHRHEQLGLIQ